MKFLNWWNKFWFEPMDLTGVALTRVVFGLTLFFTYIFRFENLNLLTSDALVVKEKALLLYPEFMRPSFSWTFWPDSLAITVHILFCLLIFLWTFGVGGRVLGILLWVIHMGFIQRNYAIVFGADVMSAVFLFYLVFIKTPGSIKNFSLIRNPKDFLNKNKESDWLSISFLRLLQIQMCVIYAYTGFEKLKGSTWWDGTALWSVFANPQMVWVDMSFIQKMPLIIPVAAFMTIVFEIYFPPAMFSKKTRVPWLIAGFFFHIGIAFFMQLWSFSFVMLAIYFIYLSPEEIKSLFNHFWNKKIIKR